MNDPYISFVIFILVVTLLGVLGSYFLRCLDIFFYGESEEKPGISKETIIIDLMLIVVATVIRVLKTATNVMHPVALLMILLLLAFAVGYVAQRITKLPVTTKDVVIFLLVVIVLTILYTVGIYIKH